MRADNKGEGGILALVALVARAHDRAARAASPARRARPVRRRAALRRRRDHAGDLGARRRSRARQVARPALRPHRRAAHASSILVGAVLRAAARHRRIGAAVRAGDAGVVRRDRRARRCARSSRTRACCRRSTRATRVAFFADHGCTASSLLGARRPVRHRRRGAVRRHGPLRPHADPHRVVRARAARRCCSTTSGRARCCSTTRRRSTNPFFALAPDWALIPDGRARDDGDGHRVAGADLRRVLADAPGGAARLLPARHVVHTSAQRRGPDLRARDQLGADGRRASRSCWRSASSTALAAAYGIAVTGTMAITSLLFFLVRRRDWDWTRGRRRSSFVPFLAIDLAFFARERRQDRRTAAGSRWSPARWSSR